MVFNQASLQSENLGLLNYNPNFFILYALNLKIRKYMSTLNSPKNKQRQLSQYQKFRMNKLSDKKDDDNHSAHFHSDITDREEQNGHPIKLLKRYPNSASLNSQADDKLDEVYVKLDEKQKECESLRVKYGELLKKYEEVEKQKQHYRKKYQERVKRDKETKLKLEGWIKEAKTDLIDPI